MQDDTAVPSRYTTAIIPGAVTAASESVLVGGAAAASDTRTTPTALAYTGVSNTWTIAALAGGMLLLGCLLRRRRGEER